MKMSSFGIGSSTRKGYLRLLVIVLLVIMSGVEGCALCHYGAHATLVTPTAATLPEPPPPSEVLGDALRPLGFTLGQNVKLGYFYYEIGVGFPGADRVSVSWYPESGLITLYDFRNFEASDLDRRVQDAIQMKIARMYGQKLGFTPNSNKSSQCIFGP
jgi:hypothetical protein